MPVGTKPPDNFDDISLARQISGEMVIRNVLTTLQIFFKFMHKSEVTSKNNTDPDDTCQGDL